ncbi:MAG: TlpA disulfide reductase family protein [Pikeienuella sp.]
MKADLSGLLGAILYGALALCATPAAADLSVAQVAVLEMAREGELRNLVFHDRPKARLETVFETGEGDQVSVADFEGKVVLLNIWAIWCPPCVEEMPALDRLRADMAGEDFELVALSMDRASTGKIREFYDRTGIETLAIHREPTLRLGAEAGVLGMPATLILDRKGREIARMMGAAEWDSEEAKTLLKAIIAALDESDG